MADLIIVYWRDIPAQIMVRQGRRSARRELPVRFAEAIDMAAMRSGASGTDDYLAEWRRGEPIAVGDDLDAEADRAVAEIETQFDKVRLAALVNSGGRNAG
ncbi:MAG: virulence factor [Notoacmeibacter sp.]|nr:virulence factor [Notoacmeibacter sp.]